MTPSPAHLRVVDANTGEVHDHHCPECERMADEVAGLESTIRSQAAKLTALRRDKERERRLYAHRELIEAIHDFWQDCTGRKGKLGPKRFDAVKALIEVGEEEWKFRLAIIGAAVAPNCSPQSGEPYDDLELICRDESKLDSFARRGWLWAQRIPREQAA